MDANAVITITGLVIGELVVWFMAGFDHYRTELIKDAIRMAAGTGLLQAGAVFHTDRGSNYTSDEIGRFLTGLSIRRSVGRTG
ncbi:MAG: family transposase, partial [Nonomuraea muscovyensis]|nr:family transposase [Nonomuraea muscovyensis]